jgi:hypothetical protein
LCLVRRLGLCLAVAVFALLLPAGLAHAQATVFRFEFQQPQGLGIVRACLAGDGQVSRPG